MKKYTRILVAIMFLLGLGVAANAEIQPVIAVDMPFEFVAGKTTLPAGAYVVKRISDQPFDVLMITSRDKGTSVFVNPTEMEGASTYKPNVSFHKVGDQHFLSSDSDSRLCLQLPRIPFGHPGGRRETTRHRLCFSKWREQVGRSVALSHGFQDILLYPRFAAGGYAEWWFITSDARCKPLGA